MILIYYILYNYIFFSEHSYNKISLSHLVVLKVLAIGNKKNIHSCHFAAPYH